MRTKENAGKTHIAAALLSLQIPFVGSHTRLDYSVTNTKMHVSRLLMIAL